MKNKILALLAIAAMSLTCACSEDESEESLDEKCQKGEAEACLVGSWQMMAIQDAAADYYIIVDLHDGPGLLELNEDYSFKYTYATSLASLMGNDCGGKFDSGKWSFDAATSTISFKFTVGEQCNSNPTSAVVKVNANELTFNKQVFQTSEDIRIGAQPIEYYKRIVTAQ